MIHATKRALAMLARRDGSDLPTEASACGYWSEPEKTESGVLLMFGTTAVDDFLAQRPPIWPFPTCPTCRVLMDAALEGRRLGELEADWWAENLRGPKALKGGGK